MTNQEQAPKKNVQEEKVHPTILRLAKRAIKEYLINLSEGTAICHEHIEMVLQMENIYLTWCDIAELILPMVAGKNKIRKFRFWFKKSEGEGKTDCLTIFTAAADDQNKMLQTYQRLLMLNQ